MDYDKVDKLLSNKRLDDILIGVALAYKLSSEDFRRLFYEDRETNIDNKPLYYRFQRDGINYGFGNACFVTYNNFPDDSRIEDRVDITPEEFKT